MGALRKSLWTIAATLAALPLPAAAQEMCAALQRIEAAAREPVPFASLEAGQGVVPGYEYCRVETGTPARIGRILCHRQLAPASLAAGVVGPKVEACLGIPPEPSRAFARSGFVFRSRLLEIRVSSHCNEHCHVGRLASFTVLIRRAEEEEDGGAPAG